MPKKAQQTQPTGKRKFDAKEGDVFVVPGGRTFTMPKINADLIQKYSENKYIFEGLTKQQRILFKKRFTVQLYDTAEQKADVKGTAMLEKMVKQPDVGLWYTLQRLWRNTVIWGPAPYNPVWGVVSNKWQLIMLRDLDPAGFAYSGNTIATVKNRILPGICVNDETEKIEFWQKRKKTGIIEQLENVDMMVDPISGEVGGTSGIIPLIPIVSMIKYVWKKQMQIINKMGIFFIRIEEPQPGDVEYVQTVMRKASTETGFHLLGNMHLEQLGIGNDGSALPTISELGMQVRQFFSPSDVISKEGTLIGGNANPEFDLLMSFTEGSHRWLEEECEYILQPFHVKNSFDDRYEIRVEIPDPMPDRAEQLVTIADSGFKTHSIGRIDRRRIYSHALAGTGIELGTLTPDQDRALDDEFAKAAPVGGMMQKAQMAIDAMKADDLDPYAIIPKREAKRIIQSTLDIKDGDM
jgi:hypothetical protein